jgi:hypothetical protein
MYRRPLFLEVLHQIREEMSREADYDVDLFAEMVRTGKQRKVAKAAAPAKKKPTGEKAGAKKNKAVKTPT